MIWRLFSARLISDTSFGDAQLSMNNLDGGHFFENNMFVWWIKPDRNNPTDILSNLSISQRIGVKVRLRLLKTVKTEEPHEWRIFMTFYL